jgi:uncharacterized membrane protein
MWGLVSRIRGVRHDSPVAKTLLRLVLGAFLLVAGISHFASLQAFLAQVPPWMPWPEFVVYASGVVEIVLGLALIVLTKQRALVGWIVAAFFVIVFPGNIWQFIEGRDAFGLDTDLARGIRLLFQPVLVVWALWCTDAWSTMRQRWRERQSA